MRNLTRKHLGILIAALLLSGGFYWYWWYNHKIAVVEIDKGFQVTFQSKYESWRGPRRVLHVTIEDAGGNIQDITDRVMSYRSNGQGPGTYYSSNRKFVCITFPGHKGNFILGDLQAGEFGTRFPGPRRVSVRDDQSNRYKLTNRWQRVANSIMLNNPLLELD